MNTIDLLKKTVKNLETGESGIIAVITDTKGSTPAKMGRMMFITSQKLYGSIGGGISEKSAIERARKMLKEGIKTEKFSVGLSGTEHSDTFCGGKVEILLINTQLKAKVLLIGAGHINIALNKYMEMLGYSVNIYDIREGLSFGNYKKIDSYDTVFKEFDNNSYLVIATHNHSEDGKVLLSLLQNKCKPLYLGMVCSKRSFKELKTNIEKMEITVPDTIFAPAGLNINGNEPNEIALSIVAQIEKIYYNKDGSDLKDVKNGN